MGKSLGVAAAVLLLLPGLALAQAGGSNRLSPGGVGFPGGLLGTGMLPGLPVDDIANVALPRSLAPRFRVRRSRVSGSPPSPRPTPTRQAVQTTGRPLPSREGVPREIVKQARDAITAAALDYDPLRVDAASAGPMERVEGGYIAPIRIRILYARQGGRETRESTISFRLNEAQRIVEALDKPRMARGGGSPGRTSPLRR